MTLKRRATPNVAFPRTLDVTSSLVLIRNGLDIAALSESGTRFDSARGCATSHCQVVNVNQEWHQTSATTLFGSNVFEINHLKSYCTFNCHMQTIVKRKARTTRLKLKVVNDNLSSDTADSLVKGGLV